MTAAFPTLSLHVPSKQLVGCLKDTTRSTTGASSSSLYILNNHHDKQEPSGTQTAMKDYSITANIITEQSHRFRGDDNHKYTTAASSSKKKVVSFSMHATVRYTIHLNDFSREEIEASWFSKYEYKIIRQNCCNEIAQMKPSKNKTYSSKSERKARKQDSGDLCSRGLECYTKLGRKTRSENRACSTQVVSEIQGTQFEQGYQDEEEIAAAYHKATNDSQTCAARNIIIIGVIYQENEYFVFTDI